MLLSATGAYQLWFNCCSKFGRILLFSYCLPIYFSDMDYPSAYFNLLKGSFMCNNREVRLVDGSSSNEGTVLYCNNAEWGTVCDDGWKRNNSLVVCRQLGLPTNCKTHFNHLYMYSIQIIILCD